MRIIKTMAGLSATAVLLLLLLPMSWANTGCWQFTDGYNVLMAMAPLAPKVGQDTSFLFSFLENEDFIKGDLKAKLKVSKGHEPSIYGSAEETIRGGIWDYKHSFNESGFHEVGVEFTVNGKKYFVDFPIEVVETKKQELFKPLIISFFAGAVAGIVFYSIYFKRRHKK